MAYKSIDEVQKAFSDGTFAYAKDRKKAAGRALGTLVELITFYILDSWGFKKNMLIERSVEEYGVTGISHNVEFSLHPALDCRTIKLPEPRLPLTSARLVRTIPSIQALNRRNNALLSRDHVLRNACVVGTTDDACHVVNLIDWSQTECEYLYTALHKKPFAVVECKRVGVEEGMSRGPQTIEKAKQGAYVARSVSSTQKVRNADGTLLGYLPLPDGNYLLEPYEKLIPRIVGSEEASLLQSLTITIGVISNHGNWFTSSDMNKEVKVLAQSYDWLIFLTDDGIVKFVNDAFLGQAEDLKAVQKAFSASYDGTRSGNRLTKVKIDLEAHMSLENYFNENESMIQSWFNLISPSKRSLTELKVDLLTLANKKWSEVHR